MIRCFLLEPTDRAELGLRRYGGKACPAMPGDHSYHEALNLIGEITEPIPDWSTPDWHQGFPPPPPLAECEGHPAWPPACRCGYVFDATFPDPEAEAVEDGDRWQVWTNRLWRRVDTGEITTLRNAPVGGVWNAAWLHRTGPDGLAIVVKTPGGDWHVDSRATNCGRPDDDVHRCWVRHGTPPDLTVDKNGDTCTAGAGSIAMGDYHGFLQNGHLT